MFVTIGVWDFSPEIKVRLLLRQLKIDVLSVLEVTDKLEFVSGACARAMRHTVPLSYRLQAVFHAQRQLRFHTPEWAYLHTRFACNSLSRAAATSYRCISSGTTNGHLTINFRSLGKCF